LLTGVLEGRGVAVGTGVGVGVGLTPGLGLGLGVGRGRCASVGERLLMSNARTTVATRVAKEIFIPGSFHNPFFPPRKEFFGNSAIFFKP